MANLAGSIKTPRVILLLLWLQSFLPIVYSGEEVYFDRWATCMRNEPLSLADEDYKLLSMGGGFAHESLLCDVKFRAPPSYGVCLTFRELEIKRCDMEIIIFKAKTTSGPVWRSLNCRDSMPSRLCTSSRDVTVYVKKQKLNQNKGYSFEILVEKSNNVAEEGMLIASIGVTIAIILGVVVLLTVSAITIVYCCCKRNSKKKKETLEAAEHQDTLVQPSAPPIDDEIHFGQVPDEPPPPYMPPPPYHSEYHTAADQSNTAFDQSSLDKH